MHTRRMRRVAMFAVLGSMSLSLSNLYCQTTAAKWWPSEWGADDQRGAANRITAKKVRQGSRLIKQGRIYQLGRVYEPGMPLFGNRHYSLSIVSSPSGGPAGQNQLVWHDEMFSGEIGQVGTQFDRLGLVGTRMGA